MERRASGMCGACGKPNDTASTLRCRRCWLKGISVNSFGSVEYADMLQVLWDKQGGRCALTGSILTPGRGASIDHIIPQCQGGTHEVENLRWVQWMVNKAKNKYSDAEFIRMCCQVADKHRGLPLQDDGTLRALDADADAEIDDL